MFIYSSINYVWPQTFKCSPVGGWVYTLWCNHITKYYTAKEMNKLLLHTVWMNLTSMKLSDSIIKFYIIKEKLISMGKSQNNGSFILEREDWLEGAGGDCWGADSTYFLKIWIIVAWVCSLCEMSFNFACIRHFSACTSQFLNVLKIINRSN